MISSKNVQTGVKIDKTDGQANSRGRETEKKIERQ